MPPRKMEALQGGESECLTQNYWAARAVVFSYKSTDEDVFICRRDVVPKLNREEVRYFYWELVHSQNRNCEAQKALMKEYLLSEFMRRKYGRIDNEGN